jgi:hypothetical protein
MTGGVLAWALAVTPVAAIRAATATSEGRNVSSDSSSMKSDRYPARLQESTLPRSGAAQLAKPSKAAGVHGNCGASVGVRNAWR